MGSQATAIAALKAALGKQQFPGVQQELRFRHSGAAFRHKLATNQNCVWAHLGDSTANGTDEWLYLALDQFRTDYPNMRVTHELWNDTNQNYDAATVLQTGAGGVTPDPIAADTFTRTAATLTGTNTEVGGMAWTGTSSVDGDEVVLAPNVANYFTHGIDAQDPAGFWVEGEIFMPAGFESSTGVRLSVLGDPSSADELMIAWPSSATGMNTSIYRRDGSTVAQSTSAFAAVASSIDRSIRFTFKVKDGVATLSTYVNGATNPGSVATLPLTAAANWAGWGKRIFKALNATASTTGPTLRSISLGRPASDPTTLRVINGSMPGANLTYFQAAGRIEKMLPVDADLLTLASSHNHSSQAVGAFVQQVKDTLDLYALPRVPSAGVVLVSQNPQFDPIVKANQDAHLARLRALRPLAAERGYGYIAGVEKFLKNTDRGKSLVATDGVHPIAAGSQAWRDAALSFLRGTTV